MLVLSAIDERAYDIAQVQIGYCKLFPLIVQDFITRQDLMKILTPDNLPVTVNPGQGVSVVVPAGTGSTVSPGTGIVSPIYTGQTLSPGSVALSRQKEVIKNSGGATVSSLLGELGG